MYEVLLSLQYLICICRKFILPLETVVSIIVTAQIEIIITIMANMSCTFVATVHSIFSSFWPSSFSLLSILKSGADNGSVLR